MKVYFDEEIDYAEIFFREGRNYGVNISDEITQFRSEDTEEVIGYSFENASETVFECKMIDENTKEEFRKVLEKSIWV